ncbi:MAG: flagellar hook-associated protein FlgL, partial [Desulfobacterales bacterium]|nr:flagellar hook-associated protein FlgL [Desulfobacterales bacterium]
MRVPTISVYKQATYQLNTITSEVSDANEEVTTGKRINTISDDPVGTGQVMALNSSLESVGQLLENVSHGQMILNQAETAMDSAADELLDLKQTCSQLATASASTQDRADAAETMDQIIETFLGLANTQVNGTYVFGGTQNNTAPFVLDNEDDPTQVIYQGNDAPVEIKTGENTTMALDCCGNDVFYEDEIIVDGTNNLVVVREDPGPEKGEPRVIEVEIPDGIYTREELATVVEDELRAASQEEGYGVGYQVDYDPEQNHFAIGEDGRGEDPISVGLVVEPTDTVRISNLESQGLETPV